jgi:hypothetical protein
MTTNITYGNTAQFVAEFLDANGKPTVPGGAVLNIAYPVGLTAVSTSITMSLVNTFFTATWQSSVSLDRHTGTSRRPAPALPKPKATLGF